jgi:hypothetical protein
MYMFIYIHIEYTMTNPSTSSSQWFEDFASTAARTDTGLAHHMNLRTLMTEVIYMYVY